MKKYMFFIFVSLMMMTVMDNIVIANEGPKNILEGLPGIVSRNQNGAQNDITYAITDNNVSTSYTFSVNTGNQVWVRFVFDDPVYIQGIRAIYNYPSTPIRFIFTDLEGQQINSNPIPIQNDTMNELHMNGVKTIHVNTSVTGWRRIINEIYAYEFYNDIPPEPVTGISAQLIGDSVRLLWNANTEPDIAGYNVYSGSGSKVNETIIRGTTYDITNLIEGNTYSFTVTAVNTSGFESEHSETVSIKIEDTTPPAVPVLIGADPNDGRITLKWGAVDDDDLLGYFVYVNGLRHNTIPIEQTSYNVRNLQNGISYRFQVSAVDHSGNESEKSNEIHAIPHDFDPPSPPKNLTASSGNEQIGVFWSANTEPDLKGYVLYLDGVAHVNTGNIYHVISGLENGRTYEVAVSAYDESGNESEKTSPVQVTPNEHSDIFPPSSPENVYGHGGERSLYVSWDHVEDDDLLGYFVYIDGRRANYSPISENEYTEINLEPGTYDVYVTAIDTFGNESEKSDVLHLHAVDTTPPGPPISLSGRAYDTYVIIRWLPNVEPDFRGYYIYVDGEKYSDHPISATEYRVAGLENGISYRFQVSAVDHSGNESELSHEVSLTPNIYDPETDIIETDEYIEISWEPVAEAYMYRIVYNGKIIDEVSADTLSYRITREMGYSPTNVVNIVEVLTVYEDGTVSEPIGREAKNWGFSAYDIFMNAVTIVFYLSSFVLFSLIFMNSRKIIRLLKSVGGGNK